MSPNPVFLVAYALLEKLKLDAWPPTSVAIVGGAVWLAEQEQHEFTLATLADGYARFAFGGIDPNPGPDNLRKYVRRAIEDLDDLYRGNPRYLELRRVRILLDQPRPGECAYCVAVLDPATGHAH